MKTLATVLASVGLVAAHGYVDNATIGGEFYQFYQPYQDPYMGDNKPARVSRSIPGNGPVEDVTSIDIQCHQNSEPAELHAAAEAGSEVTLRWTLWPESHMGPVITYMARCPDAGCQDWTPGTEEVWFKIDEGGRDGTSGTWAATPLMTAPAEYKYTIPSCLQTGFYLVRHEIIALHAAYQYPGAQFYPGCHQLNVTGTGSTVPSSLVAFPGAYKGTDAGITYDAYKAQAYEIPGPAVFTCDGSNSGSADPVETPETNDTESSSSEAAAVPTSSVAPAETSSEAPAQATSEAPAVTTPAESAAAPTASSEAPAQPTECAAKKKKRAAKRAAKKAAKRSKKVFDLGL